MKPIYLDCAATSPIEPEVLDEVVRYLRDEFGNAGSRTHEYGAVAKRRVQHAREQVAAIASANADEVVFTSGATESNNLAILGLARYGAAIEKRHVVTTAIEHKAVLEPMEKLARLGFALEHVEPDADGRVQSDAVLERIRPDTLLVSVMAANNETGVRQPIHEIATGLSASDAFLHVDAAQSFGKDEESLPSRVDLISVSGHKLFAPKGIGALIARRRGFERPPLEPLLLGGGQERGLRAGTAPVALIAGLGTAAELAIRDGGSRRRVCSSVRAGLIRIFAGLGAVVNGSPDHALPNILNVSIPNVDSEAFMLAAKPWIAVSNGSACTSSSYAPSHVLQAMGLPPERIASAVRISWSHLTPRADWDSVVEAVSQLLVGKRLPAV